MLHAVNIEFHMQIKQTPGYNYVRQSSSKIYGPE